MKNITKIIESNELILDKCAYWFDTNKEVLKRYTQGVWKPILSSSSFSFSAIDPLSLQKDESGTNVLLLNYSTTDFKLNDNNELALKSNSYNIQKRYPKADYTVVKWCPKGKINLDTDLNKPCIIPPRSKCPMIRFSCDYLRKTYLTKTNISCRNLTEYNLHDLVEDTRLTILNKLNIVNLPLRRPFCCHGPFITWKIKKTGNICVSCNCRVRNPYWCVNLDCLRLSPHYFKNFVISTQDPIIFSHSTDTGSFTITPYITFVNPFTIYGGLIIVKNYSEKDGNITLEFTIGRIPPKSRYYEPSVQSLIEYNEDGVQCKGSYITKKRRIFFTTRGRNYTKFKTIDNILLYSYPTKSMLYCISDYKRAKDNSPELHFDKLIIHKNADRRKVISEEDILRLVQKNSRFSMWLVPLDPEYNFNQNRRKAVNFTIQDIDALYKKTRTQSEYAERYRQNIEGHLSFVGLL